MRSSASNANCPVGRVSYASFLYSIVLHLHRKHRHRGAAKTRNAGNQATAQLVPWIAQAVVAAETAKLRSRPTPTSHSSPWRCVRPQDVAWRYQAFASSSAAASPTTPNDSRPGRTPSAITSASMTVSSALPGTPLGRQAPGRAATGPSTRMPKICSTTEVLFDGGSASNEPEIYRQHSTSTRKWCHRRKSTRNNVKEQQYPQYHRKREVRWWQMWRRRPERRKSRRHGVKDFRLSPLSADRDGFFHSAISQTVMIFLCRWPGIKITLATRWIISNSNNGEKLLLC